MIRGPQKNGRHHVTSVKYTHFLYANELLNIVTNMAAVCLHGYHGTYYSGAWSARTADGNQWITASFFSTIVVTGLTTAGRTDNDEWVASYKIQYQPDYYSEWATYNDPPGKAKVR